MVIFADEPVPAVYSADGAPPGCRTVEVQQGDYVAVEVTRSSTGTLMGVCLGKTTLAGFHRQHGAAWAEPGAFKSRAGAAGGAGMQAASAAR